MAKSSLSSDVLRSEKSSHMTKEQLSQRSKAEADLLTGSPMQESAEVAADPVAHAEFMRVSDLLEAIGKNDDLYGSSINRYCQMKSECSRLEAMKADADTDTELKIDRELRSLWKEMFRIEESNCMTVASSLRSMPKKVTPKKSPLMEILESEG